MAEIVIKQRDAGICNLKLVLIYLVVLGHLLEPCIYESNYAKAVYFLIYTTHMPAFAFVSGLYMKQAKRCVDQAVRALILYLSFQIIFLILYDRGGSIFTPYWHLWYLLSLSFWAFSSSVYYFLANKLRFLYSTPVKVMIIAASMAVGCAIGLIENVDRDLSLSRSIVFFPYFLIGSLFDIKLTDEYKKLKGAVLLVWGSILALGLYFAVSYAFLYHASSFSGMSGHYGLIMRAFCYIIGIIMTVGLLLITPERRFHFTKCGTDTLMIYVAHGPIVKMLRSYRNEKYYLLICPLIAAAVIFVLYKSFNGNNRLYRITSKGKPKGG